MEIPQRVLHVAQATGRDDPRHGINGIEVRAEEDGAARLTATDGDWLLSIKSQPILRGDTTVPTGIIPGDVARSSLRPARTTVDVIKADKRWDLRLAVSPSEVREYRGAETLGMFPEWGRILPAEARNGYRHLWVDPHLLAEALTTMAKTMGWQDQRRKSGDLEGAVRISFPPPADGANGVCQGPLILEARERHEHTDEVFCVLMPLKADADITASSSPGEWTATAGLQHEEPTAAEE